MSSWLRPDSRGPRTLAYDRAVAWCLAGLLSVAYLLSYTGVIQSSDGLAMFVTAESMARRGEIDSNQILWTGAQQGNFGPDGQLYSRKGLGMTLLALPLVWLALIWPAIGLTHAALLLNPILTAWTAALVYLTGRRLQWSPGGSALTALAFGLGTLAWPYTQTFFSDPVCMWGLFGAAYGLLAHAQTGRKRYLFAAGVAWSIAYLARVVNLVALPLYALGLVLAIQAAFAAPGAAQRPWRAYIAWLWRDAWRQLISFGLPVVVAGLVSLYWNWARYGNIWDSGYVETERFNAIWWFGVSGLIVGPARGLFWYSPVLLLAIWGAFLLWRQARAATLAALAISVLYVLLYGKWYMWHGGYSWGPRFLVPILPFLSILAGAAITEILAQRAVLLNIGLGFLFALSIAVQILGLLVPFGLVQDWLDATVQPLFAPETFTRLEYSPLYLQWQFLQPQHMHLLWFSGWGSWGPRMWLIFGLLVLLLVAGGVLLHRMIRAHAPHGVWASTARPFTLAVAITTVMFLTTIYAHTAHAHQRQLAQRIGELEKPGDAILHLRPQDTQAFANGYHGRLPVYGRLDRGELDETDHLWHTVLRQEYQRLWVVPAMESAEHSAWERELRAEDFLLYDFRVPNSEAVRLALFASSLSQPLQEAGLGTIFGDPAHAERGISAANGWIRLGGYGLTPETRPGGELLLALRWESLQPLDYDYHVFVHLLDPSGSRIAQRDGQPVQWMRPTSSWQPGEEIIDRYGLLLSPDLTPSEYTLAVGLYDPVSGQRLPVSAGPSSYAIEIGPIPVRPQP